MSATVESTSRFGLHDGIDEAEYHADRGSLSVSGAKVLLGKSPAHFKWEREHRTEKRAFDFGHAAHKAVLGTGAPLVIVQADNWTTKAAKQQRDAAYEANHVPILAKEYETVQAMAAAIQAHPLAGRLFDPEHGKAEQSGYFPDEKTGITRRFRLDWLPDQHDGPMVIPDYKTTTDASPRAISRYLASFGYAQQAAWYLDGVAATIGAHDAEFILVLQEKTAPYVVTVARPDLMALQWGAQRNRQALDLYADCVANNTWPAYGDDILTVTVPDWALADLDMMEMS